MKKLFLLSTILLNAIVVLAQTVSPEMEMKITVNGTVEAKTSDGQSINLTGVLTLPANAFETIVFDYKPIEGLEAIQLIDGSTIKWANINYGASQPNEAGKLLLWNSDDIVYNDWGKPRNDKWRTPTIDEIEDLRQKCKWEWAKLNGIDGFWVINKTDADNSTIPFEDKRKIFLPVTGYKENGFDETNSLSRGYYWSSSLYPNDHSKAYALLLDYEQNNNRGIKEERSIADYLYAIRPVWGDPAISATVTTGAAQPSFNTATIPVTVTSDDNIEVESFGVYYSTSEDMSGQKTATGSGTLTKGSAKNVDLTGLTDGGTTYYYQAFVRLTAVSTPFVGEKKSFTTNTKSLSISSVIPSDLTATSVNLAVTITGDALGEVSYGAYYATSEADLADAGKRKETKGAETLSGSAVTLSLTDLTAETTYYYQVYAQRGNETPKTETGEFTTLKQVDPNAPQPVSLGLSVQWADRNIGAKKPSDYGGSYGFGDADGTEMRTNGGYYASGKNFTSIGGDENYDIATKQLGEHWRLPTCKEIEELSKCKIAWDTEDGVNGWRVTSNNGNSIFIPCAGTWTKTQDENGNEIYNQRKERAYIWSDSATTSSDAIYYRIETTPAAGTLNRYIGLSIRPVYDDGTGQKPVDVDPSKDLTNEIAAGSDPDGEGGLIPQAGIDMGTPGIKWARWNVGVKNKTGELGHYYAWGEKARKETYSNDTYTVNFKDMMSRELNHVLPDSADVAKELWGGKWRMPKSSEIFSLIEACDFEWTTDGGLEGYKLTSKTTGNTLFLPAGGYKRDNTTYVEGIRGCYWSASAYNSGNDEKKRIYATYLNFTSSGAPTNTDAIERYYGMLIRPVIDD